MTNKMVMEQNGAYIFRDHLSQRHCEYTRSAHPQGAVIQPSCICVVARIELDQCGAVRSSGGGWLLTGPWPR